MTLVGKEFPNLAVDAMNEMGDTFKVNILEEAKSKNKQFYNNTHDNSILWNF